MMKQVQCRCEAMVDIDVPDALELEAAALARLAEGEAPAATCPRCGTVVRAELPLRVRSAGLDVIVLPETERLAAYRGKVPVQAGTELLLGYQELFERARCLRDGLTPLALEALKHAIETKAAESGGTDEIVALYNGLEGDALAFHVLGLKPGEAGVVRVPKGAYESVARDAVRLAAKEPYASLKAGSYHGSRKLGFLDAD